MGAPIFSPGPDPLVPVAMRDTLRVMLTTVSQMTESDRTEELVRAIGYATSFCVHLMTVSGIFSEGVGLFTEARDVGCYTRMSHGYHHRPRVVSSRGLGLTTADLRAGFLDAGSEALGLAAQIYDCVKATHEAIADDLDVGYAR